FDVNTQGNGLRYEWTFNPGATSTEKSPEYSFHKNGAYIVTLKIFNSLGNLLCENNAKIEISCFPESPRCEDLDDPIRKYISGLTSTDGIVVHHGPFLWSVYCKQNGLNPAYQLRTKFFIRGTLIMDVNCVFEGTNWIMDEGAEIIAINKIECKNQDIFNGCEKIWKGINLNKASNKFKNTTFYDAEKAISISQGNNNSFVSCDFINNSVGVYIEGAPGVDIVFPFRTFKGNILKGEGMLKPPFKDQQLVFDQYPLAGIYALNTKTMLVNGTEKNEFENMMYGIFLNRSNIIANNNEFKNLKKVNSDISEGSGIYSIFARNTSVIKHNTFLDSRNGIYFRKLSSNIIDINNNTLKNSSNAGLYFHENGFESKIKIENNKEIMYNEHGILLQGISNSNSISISHNREIVGNRFGINLSSCVGKPDQTSIINNKLFFSESSDFGIFLSNTKDKWKIKNNELNLTANGTRPRSGISLGTSSNNIIEENIVEKGNGLATNYSFTSSSNNIIKCNKSFNGITGFEFSGTCLATNFQANEMKNNSNGLVIEKAVIASMDEQGNIGAQEYKGNTWEGPNTKAVIDESSLTDANQFIYNPSLTNPAPPTPLAKWKPENTVKVNPAGVETPISNWFLQQSLESNKTCDSNLPPLANSSLELLDKVIDGTLFMNENADQNAWTGHWQLFDIINEDFTLLGRNQKLANFYNENIVVKSYYYINKNIEDIHIMNDDQTFALSGLQNNIDPLEQELIANANAEENNFNEDMVNEKVDALRHLLIEANTIYDKQEEEVRKRAFTLREEVGALSESYIFCKDYKDVFLASLDQILLNDEDFTSTHGNNLKRIAESCIDEVGKPVFIARGLCTAF
ncbi:MAG: hypothetical protein RLZZ546_1348, partial [Bacteroidota bacterium]